MAEVFDFHPLFTKIGFSLMALKQSARLGSYDTTIRGLFENFIGRVPQDSKEE